MLIISGDSVWWESCTCKRLAGTMDLSEKWPLEEGTWLSHAGVHHFANTRGGMATFAVPDTCGPLQLMHSLGQPSCSQYVPSAICLFKSSWVERRRHGLWSQTDPGSDTEFSLYTLWGLKKIYCFLSLNMRVRMPAWGLWWAPLSNVSCHWLSPRPSCLGRWSHSFEHLTCQALFSCLSPISSCFIFSPQPCKD